MAALLCLELENSSISLRAGRISSKRLRAGLRFKHTFCDLSRAHATLLFNSRGESWMITPKDSGECTTSCTIYPNLPRCTQGANGSSRRPKEQTSPNTLRVATRINRWCEGCWLSTREAPAPPPETVPTPTKKMGFTERSKAGRKKSSEHCPNDPLRPANAWQT